MPLSPPCTAQAVMHFPQVTPFTMWAPDVSPRLFLVSLWSVHTFFSLPYPLQRAPHGVTPQKALKNSQAHPCAVRVSRNANLMAPFEGIEELMFHFLSWVVGTQLSCVAFMSFSVLMIS